MGYETNVPPALSAPEGGAVEVPRDFSDKAQLLLVPPAGFVLEGPLQSSDHEGFMTQQAIWALTIERFRNAYSQPFGDLLVAACTQMKRYLPALDPSVRGDLIKALSLLADLCENLRFAARHTVGAVQSDIVDRVLGVAGSAPLALTDKSGSDPVVPEVSESEWNARRFYEVLLTLTTNLTELADAADDPARTAECIYRLQATTPDSITNNLGALADLIRDNPKAFKSVSMVRFAPPELVEALDEDDQKTLRDQAIMAHLDFDPTDYLDALLSALPSEDRDKIGRLEGQMKGLLQVLSPKTRKTATDRWSCSKEALKKVKEFLQDEGLMTELNKADEKIRDLFLDLVFSALAEMCSAVTTSPENFQNGVELYQHYAASISFSTGQLQLDPNQFLTSKRWPDEEE